jgi:hypothetical protein
MSSPLSLCVLLLPQAGRAVKHILALVNRQLMTNIALSHLVDLPHRSIRRVSPAGIFLQVRLEVLALG